jgi:predicted nucleic acid-binding protein
MIVVDANVVAYLLIPGQYTAAARGALMRDLEWAAPILWRSEFRNVLAPYVRKGELSLDQARGLQEAAEDLLAGREHFVASGEVLTLASISGRSVYDCEFIAVARRLGKKVITSDRPLLASFSGATVPLSTFESDVADV